MTLRAFHNALRILLNIDRDELEAAGVIPRGDHNAWGDFRQNPWRFFIRAPDPAAEKLWAMIEARQPAAYRDEGAAHG